jgi:D-alanyl-D-alanine carboxypeptidase (penicillin-binding protein 5/6)
MLRIAATWLAVIVATGPGPAFAASVTSPGPDGIRAPEAVIADARDGDILWGRDQNAERPVASITKVMTALVVLRSGRLDREVPVPGAVSWYVIENDASNAGLRAGDRLSAVQLLYAMLLPSGADAAYSLAQAYGPGSAPFVARMNATARRLGMRHTRFTNFDGLPYPSGDADHSTAVDLVKLGRTAMTWRMFRQVVGAHGYRVRTSRGHRSYYWKNLDPLIARPGVLGIKSGWTTAAGQCLLFEASRDGASLIGVVLKEPSVSSVVRDASHLLDWGFAHLPGRRGAAPGSCGQGRPVGCALSAGDSARCAGMATVVSTLRPPTGMCLPPWTGPFIAVPPLRWPGLRAARNTAASQKARQPRMMTHITHRRQSDVSRLVSITNHLIGITRPTLYVPVLARMSPVTAAG